MKTIELFAGIGGFRVAADLHNLETVWANDVNELSCSVYKKHYGDALIAGDIRSLISTVPAHDLLTAGFPCQPFSSAGKKQGVRDPRGTLFESIIDVLRLHSPQYFVLENVKRLLAMEGGDHFATILASLTSLGYFVEWRLLNAKNFGLAQNRERVILVGEKIIKTPDVLLSRLATRADFASNGISQPKAAGIEGRWISFSDHARVFCNWGCAINKEYVTMDVDGFSSSMPMKKLRDVLERSTDRVFDLTAATLGRLQYNSEVNRMVQGVQIISNQAGGARMGYTIFGTDGIAPTLTASTSRHYERYFIDGRYRRLTNVEYARLQGFPDSYCDGVSVYDQYTLYGNAVPPPMIYWVLKRLLASIEDAPRVTNAKQLEIFEYA